MEGIPYVCAVEQTLFEVFGFRAQDEEMAQLPFAVAQANHDIGELVLVEEISGVQYRRSIRSRSHGLYIVYTEVECRSKGL